SWNKADKINNHATGWRHDLNTGTYTMLGSLQNGQNGYVRDPMPIGSRVQYELWSNNPEAPGSTLISKTPEARVYSVEQHGDSRDGAAATPQSAQSLIEPSLDVTSDRVGALVGKFAVDPAGNAGYEIPIVVSAGKGGLQPNLALSYSSSAADGYLGTGMALSGVSTIAACRPGSEFDDANLFSTNPSEFCLDGQRLLHVGGAPHRQLNALYKTEIDNQSLIAITAVESVNVLGVPVQALRFTVHGKDGTVRNFGGIDGVVTTRTRDSEFHAIAWKQTSLADAMGNAITYQYSSHNSAGQRYLTWIHYTGGS